MKLPIFLLTVLATAPLSLKGQSNWNGSSSTDWATGANWSTNAVPTSSDDVVFGPATTNTVTTAISSSINARSIEVLPNQVYNVSVGAGTNLTLGGSVTVRDNSRFTYASGSAGDVLGATRFDIGSGSTMDIIDVRFDTPLLQGVSSTMSTFSLENLDLLANTTTLRQATFNMGGSILANNDIVMDDADLVFTASNSELRGPSAAVSSLSGSGSWNFDTLNFPPTTVSSGNAAVSADFLDITNIDLIVSGNGSYDFFTDGPVVLANYNTLAGTQFASVTLPPDTTIDYDFNSSFGQIAIVTTIPEPSGVALLAASGVAILLRRRRR